MKLTIYAVAAALSVGAAGAQELSFMDGDPGDISGLYFGGSLIGETSVPMAYSDSNDPAFYNALAGQVFVGWNHVLDGGPFFGVEAALRSDLTTQDTFLYVTLSPSEIREIAAPSAGFRVGQQFGNLLVYGRVSAGASFVTATTEFTTGTGTIETKHPILGTLAAAIGAEYNWDRIFIRGELEARHLAGVIGYSTEHSITQFGANLGGGIRF